VIVAGIRRLGTRLVAVVDQGGQAQDRAGRLTLIVASTTVAVLAVAWVGTYLLLDRPVAAAIPLTYQVATVIGLIAVARGRSFAAFRASQLAMMTILPFALQWAIGGYAASSAVSLWALVVALGAVFFLGARGAVKWFVAFGVLTIISVAADPYLAAQATPLPPGVRTVFFGLNVMGVAIASYLELQYFVREREAALVALDAEHARSEALLRNILPGSIADRLKGGATVLADAHPAVTVLFADIVDFTPYAERTGPEDVVQLLDRVFSAFDDVADAHGLEKIKTIGDAYLLVGGLPEARDDHAMAVARASLDLISASDRLSRETGIPLRIRVGMDTGPVVAGVIGRRKFSYDLWGDTVNTASRMESNGAAGRINVTGRVEATLRDEFEFEPRGPVEVKGKGSIEAFFLIGPRAT